MRYKALFAGLLICQTLFSQSPGTPLGQQVTPVAPSFEAPSIVSTRFSSDYPNHSAKWSKSGENHYAAEITDSKTQTKKIIVYDNFGNLLYTQSELKPKNFPRSISSYLGTKFPDEEFVIWNQQDARKNLFYFTEHNKDTIRFDTAGRILSRPMQAPGHPANKE